MFSRNDLLSFIAAGTLVAAAYLLMAFDPADYGFGVATLWVAPPLLLLGFAIPVLGIIGAEHVFRSAFNIEKQNISKHFFGFIAFLLAFSVYVRTLEPTASLWDCSEFIASAYKLQVPHTPGTPLSLLIGRLFSMIALNDVTQVAWCVNLMSGLFSALTVAMVYYVIYFLGETIAKGMSRQVRTVLIISSLGGSLSLAFSDTFWFSAVEAETYGPACFFLVLLIWLILTGKDIVGPRKSRRLILIFYVAGLAYCIHPMCLLALPALPLVWLSEGRRSGVKKTLVLVAAGLALVLFINRFVAVGMFEMAFAFDLVVVNHFSLPFYSGALVFVLALICVAALLIIRFPAWRNYAWAMVFLMAGFTPYLLLFIRSNHNPPIDETNPENLAMIKAYMNRESYPSSPLVYGPYFDAELVDITVKKQMYFKGKDKYQIAGTLPEYHYGERQTLLPRLYSNDPNHIAAYRGWLGLGSDEIPAFSDNLRFLFSYQLGHMYFRYLMWNFAGRESDVQDSGWLKPWDMAGLSEPQPARNQYWMIPLLVGMLGAVFQFQKDRKGFYFVTVFFLMTGLVLALYLNSPPVEPRERDYIYVGSYIAFCLWIGVGLLSLGLLASRTRVSMILFVILSTAVPLRMFYENFDDHDRSGRTFQIDNARNILRSCAPNSILFTGGDNDTFPLWYLQEVEAFRTDVRVMVLSYMNTDWYIHQLTRTYYDSGAFKFTLGEKDYRQYGPNDVLYIQETIKGGIDLMQYLTLLKNEHPALRNFARNGEPFHILPSRILKIRPPAATPLLVNHSDQKRPVNEDIILRVEGGYLQKNALAILDLIVSNDWKRPVHFNFTSMNTLGIDLAPYLVQEGNVYRLSPTASGPEIKVDTGLAYKNLITQADYANLADPEIHLSYEDHYARMLVPLRLSFNALAIAFLNEGNVEMAGVVMQHAIEKLYHQHLLPSYTNLQAAEILRAIEKDEEADRVSRSAFNYYYSRVKAARDRQQKPDDLEIYVLRRSAELLQTSGDSSYVQQVRALDNR